MEILLDVKLLIRQVSTQEWAQAVLHFLLLDICLVVFIIGLFKTSLDRELLGTQS